MINLLEEVKIHKMPLMNNLLGEEIKEVEWDLMINQLEVKGIK